MQKKTKKKPFSVSPLVPILFLTLSSHARCCRPHPSPDPRHGFAIECIGTRSAAIGGAPTHYLHGVRP